MTLRDEVRKRIAALNGAEFSYLIAADLKHGGQAVGDLHEKGEITLVRLQKDKGVRGYKVYKAIPTHMVQRSETYFVAPELMPFLLGGDPNMKPPKGKRREHRVGL